MLEWLNKICFALSDDKLTNILENIVALGAILGFIWAIIKKIIKSYSSREVQNKPRPSTPVVRTIDREAERKKDMVKRFLLSIIPPVNENGESIYSHPWSVVKSIYEVKPSPTLNENERLLTMNDRDAYFAAGYFNEFWIDYPDNMYNRTQLLKQEFDDCGSSTINKVVCFDPVFYTLVKQYIETGNIN